MQTSQQQTPSTPPKRTHYERIICACAFLFMLTNMGLTSTTFPVFQPYINALPSMNDTLGSWVVAVRMGSAFIATMATTAFYRTFDCRIGITIMCASAAIGSALFASATTFPLFCAGAIFTGSAYGLGGTVAMTLLIGRWFNRNKATALAIASMGTGCAAIVISPLMTYVVETSSLSTAFWIECAIAGCIALLEALLLRNNPADFPLPKTDDENAHSTLPANAATALAPETAICDTPHDGTIALNNAAQGEGLVHNDTLTPGNNVTPVSLTSSLPPVKKQRNVLSRRAFAAMEIAIFLLGLCSVGANAYLSVLMSTNGYDAFHIAEVLMVSGVCLMVCKLAAGIALDRLGVTLGSTLCFASFIAGCALLCFAPSGSFLLIIVATILVYAGQPISSIGISSWAITFSTMEHRANTIKRFQLCFTAGTFVCNLFPGALYDITGSYVPTYIIFFSAIVIAASIIIHTCRTHE